MTSLAFWLVAGLAARPSALDALDQKGREAFQAGDHVTAADAFGTLLAKLPERDPLRLQTLYNHARALQEGGRPCDAVTSFDAYLGDARSKQKREAKRRAKAVAAAESARTACEAERQAAARPPPIEVPVVPDPPVETPPPPVEEPRRSTTGLVLMAGLVSGAVVGSETARARTSAGLGGGYQLGRWVVDAELRLSVESPEAASEAAVMLRPGVRWKWNEVGYLRASLPVLLAPLSAYGLGGGVGFRWPSGSAFGATGELGTTLWAASPLVWGMDARLGVEAAF